MTSQAPLNPNTRVVITMPIRSFELVMQLFERAAAQGLVHPSEMILAGRAWEAMSTAQTVQLPDPPKPEEGPEAPQA